MKYLMCACGLPLIVVSLTLCISVTGCSNDDGTSANRTCTSAGLAEPCSCIGGTVGERICGDDMMFGPCSNCQQADDNPPVDDRCFLCLDSEPYASLCDPGSTAVQLTGGKVCIEGESRAACSSLSACCEVFGRRAGDDETCGRCLDRFAGADCTECNTRFTGPDCADCAERFTGNDCEQCISRFAGPECELCADRFTGTDCTECRNPRFTGPECTLCADERITGVNCDQCRNERFTGENCDTCIEGLGGPDCTLEFVTLPAGQFEMGSNSLSSFVSEIPVHSVRVPRFEMAKTEVTVGEYRRCVNAGVCTAPIQDWEPTPGQREDHPVVWVTWAQAKTYAEFAGARLPTEAEWEYAAKSAGQNVIYPWGNDEPDCGRGRLANCCQWSARDMCLNDTAAVCNYPSGNSMQGLCDLSGNVIEWVEDDFHDDYRGAPVDGSAWIDRPRGMRRSARGGSYTDYYEQDGPFDGIFVRASSRFAPPADEAYPFIGFRLARNIRENGE